MEDAQACHTEWGLKKSLTRMIGSSDQNGVKLLLDSYSQRYLRDANIDYIESLMGSGFKINNPNVTKSCSCGHSFSTE